MCCATRPARGVPVLFSSHQLELVEHVCESVAIIDHGRLVACGPVDELRAAALKGRRGAAWHALTFVELSPTLAELFRDLVGA